jgi:hypothetical protein
MKNAISMRTILGFSTILCLALAMPAWAKGKTGGGGSGGGGGTASAACSGSSGKTYNVTSNILGLPTDPSPFQLLSDGTQSYTTIKYSRNDSVLSEIQGGTCDWELSISPSSTQRAVQLSLAYAVPGQSPPPTLPLQWSPNSSGFVSFPAIIMTNCSGNSKNGSNSVGNMTGGQSLQCGLHITFYSGGTQYSLRMNPSVWSGATWGQAVCKDPTGTSPCTDWTITPGQYGYYGAGGATGTYALDGLTNQDPSGIGELVLPSCDGCTGGTPMGLYYVAFNFTITNP